jgi:meso-butanediol dehydrogenase/(S,S)-butanediol dehydrogenase/diacetyl reductase
MGQYICKDRFKGYVVLITGAGSGLGQACAIRFAQEGALVLVADINSESIKETTEKIKDLGGSSEGYKLDITKVDEIDGVVGRIIEKHKKIDVLVNSAGLSIENKIEDLSIEEWLAHIDVNLNGTFYITRPVLKNMRERKFGKIIYISSKSGINARPRRTAYSAAKFGVNGFTQALALEVAKEGITVNSICPSRVETKMLESVLVGRAKKFNIPYEDVREEHRQSIPVGRLGRPEEVASVVVFLASEDATYVTGQFISVSGGR